MSKVTAQLENIRERVESAKVQKAKAEGAVERIEQQWLDDYEIKDGDTTAVKAKIKELDDKTTADQKRLDELMEDLETSTDWDDEDDE